MGIIGGALAAVIDPDPGRRERRGAWLERHPLAALALMAALTAAAYVAIRAYIWAVAAIAELLL